MNRLSELTSQSPPNPLLNQVELNWEDVPSAEREKCIKYASESCKVICEIIAPNAADALYNSLPQEKPVSEDLITLMKAYSSAPTRNTRLQILSIYAYDYPAKKLQALHEPYSKLSRWQIKRARQHAKENGPGIVVTKPKTHRVSLDIEKVDHFISFLNRPYFHQDVAFGMRKVKMESGEVLEMPNVIRTVTRATMISQYESFCNEQSFVPLSKSSLFRILQVREASERKSLQGLDNVAADGSAAFLGIEKLTGDLVVVGVSNAWASEVRERLRKGKQYLKTDYKVHCNEADSPCADHCRRYALSDPQDKDLHEKCQHLHNILCASCEDIKSVLKNVESMIQSHSDPRFTEEQRADFLHDFNEAKNLILLWKAHILRGVNQELGKQHAIDNLDESSSLIVMDWAMKFVQMKYREKQSEWFGKRGMSWHVTSAITKDASTNEVVVKSFIHLFDNCSQDWFSVLSIIEDTLKTMKSDNPQLDKIYLRSDEAGCYHNSLLVAAVRDIAKKCGISQVRYDFSEPQCGKDVCDRIICPLKSSLRAYCNEGNDIMTAHDMHTALEEHPVRGAVPTVNKVNPTAKKLEINKIKNFSAYHNFTFNSKNITVWKAFGVGKGKQIPMKSIYKSHQESTGMETVCATNRQAAPRQAPKKRAEKDRSEPVNLPFECKEPGCNLTFPSLYDAEKHMAVGEHKRFVQNESVYDTLRREWVHKFRTVEGELVSKESTHEKRKNSSKSDLSMGWALTKERKCARFPPKVKAYLTQRFKLGETTGSKVNPEQVVLDMRNARNKEGERLFGREDWLSKNQVKSFFSRMAKKRKDEIWHSEGDSEASEDEQEKEDRDELIQKITSTICVEHPIVFDVYNLCSIFSEGKLHATFKVAMLKHICEHFELQTKSKKGDLVEEIEKMLRQCPCQR